ncbi:hypothetical protein B9Z55_001847 [Caenorhabditis nigoni]|uniref:Uncharacterized protein n=1 Tax=Caenorhabditis nigoni TaxID=1611254 RepID=A0A2G5VHN5_9PELO|nr:hypothetical protein B9Z55_001847 [Caenorhabditis nigoni]
MLLFCRIVLLGILFAVTSACSTMDVPVLQKIAQGLCTSSCTNQKCAGGTCKKVDSHPKCFCNGCSPGSIDEVSLDSLKSKLPH